MFCVLLKIENKESLDLGKILSLHNSLMDFEYQIGNCDSRHITLTMKIKYHPLLMYDTKLLNYFS